MGFQEAKRKALTALQDGKVAYETREAQEKKNLLATGAITFAEAASIIGLTRGHQASCSPHHLDEQLEVWVFRPTDWYIKFYFLDDCMFVSFHKVGV